MRLNLQTASQLLAEYVDYGTCADDPRVAQWINRAVERLLPALNPEKTIYRYTFEVQDQQGKVPFITMPRDVKTALGSRIEFDQCDNGMCSPGCNQTVQVRSRWYEVLSGGPVGHLPCSPNTLVDMGTGFCTFSDVASDGSEFLRVYADVPQPISEGILLVKGLDGNGDPLNTMLASNQISYYLDIAIPALGQNYVDSTTAVTKIDAITKPATQGIVRLYAVNSVTGVQRPIGVYAPDELLPDYRRYLLTWCGVQIPSTIVVLVKRQFIWTTDPFADLLITNVGALENMLACMKYEKAGAPQLAATFEQNALKILERETRDYDGDYRASPTYADCFGCGEVWNLH
jgi:hypothetical protein